MKQHQATLIPARKQIGSKTEQVPKLRVAAYCRVSTDSDEQASKHKNIFISVARYGITFSMGTLEALDKPENVNLFFDSKGKRMAIQAALTSGKWKFFTTDKKRYIRWNNKKVLLKMANVAGFSLSNMMDKRFEGTYFDSENVVIFEFAKVGTVSKKNSYVVM